MNWERFERIVEAYGASPRRWPEAERAAAEAFAAHDTRAAALLKEEDAFDAMLDFARTEPRASDLLRARVLAKAPKGVRQPFERGNTVRPALALAACAMFGVIIGVSGGALAPAAAQTESVDEMVASALFQDVAAEIETYGVDG